MRRKFHGMKMVMRQLGGRGDLLLSLKVLSFEVQA
jgi:hypothetical protein